MKRDGAGGKPNSPKNKKARRRVIDRESSRVRPSPFDEKPLTGAQRSRLSLERVSYMNELARLKVPVTRTVNDLRWLPASGLTIERDLTNTVAQEMWHAGHTCALLVVDPFVIAASQTGGVWLINHYPQAMSLAGSHPATLLSTDWDNPDMICLAFGPGVTDQFYAGGRDGTLHLVELQPVLGGMESKRSTLIPLPFSDTIQQIVVLEASRRIVLAISNGVYWSQIPELLSDFSSYDWQAAQDLPEGKYSGLAEGPQQTIVAAAWGSENPGNAPHGIFHGSWIDGQLIFAHSAINGTDENQMQRTSLTSCAAQRSIMYAVAAGGEKAGKDFAILAVLASDNGGISWSTVTKPTSTDSGFQGNYNQAIAVSPVRPNVVVLAWRAGGPFFSTNGGLTWTHPTTDGGPTRNDNLHGDLHALCFARHYDAANTDWVFVGSDGGIANTRDLGHSWDSRYAKQLRTLQFSTSPFVMNLTASSRIPGLIAGGTQDNGNIFCYRGGHRPWWFRMQGGDGAPNRIIDTLGSGAILLYNNDAKSPTVRLAFWDAQTESFGDDFSHIVPVDGNATGLMTPWMEVVRKPTWSRNGKLLYAVAGTRNAGLVYGFFANPDGSDAQFQKLADVGNSITALDSWDGSKILIATLESSGGALALRSKTHIMLLDATTGAVMDISLPKVLQSGSVDRLAMPASDRILALNGNSRLMRFDANGWHEMEGNGFVVFDPDPRAGSRRVFAATDTTVFVSDDDGATWANASMGLPACPHCVDLRIVEDGKGGHDIYLATQGSSVWRAQIDYVEKGPDFRDVPPLVGDVLAGILGDGEGFVRIGGHIIHIGPHGPVLDILSALAVEKIAESMSQTAGDSMRLAAMNVIKNIAEKQIRELKNSR